MDFNFCTFRFVEMFSKMYYNPEEKRVTFVPKQAAYKQEDLRHFWSFGHTTKNNTFYNKGDSKKLHSLDCDPYVK